MLGKLDQIHTMTDGAGQAAAVHPNSRVSAINLDRVFTVVRGKPPLADLTNVPFVLLLDPATHRRI